VLTGTTQSGAPTSPQVTGLFRARNPASPYWGLDLLPVAGVAVNGSSISRSSISYAGISQQTSYVSYGPAVVNPAAFGGTLTASQGIRDGKTSSENIRHAATDERGKTTLHAREYATLDRAGRVQLPREMTRRLGMRKRVELQEEPDHIGVWPDQAADQEPD
jgi:hypothetical protein